MGAPGAFPVERQNWKLQKYMHWSAAIEKKAERFIKDSLPAGTFVGIHLRNGVDFVRTQRHVHPTLVECTEDKYQWNCCLSNSLQ